MEKRKSLSAERRTEFWQKHIEGWRQSGLSQREYCRRHAINHNAFTWRKRSLGGYAKTGLTRVPIILDAVQNNPAGVIELLIGMNIRLKLEKGFDTDTLKRVIDVLGGQI